MRSLEALAALLLRIEPHNPELYYSFSRPFARLAGRNSDVLRQTLALVERAHKLAPALCAYASEVGYQQMLLGQLADASATLRRAGQLEGGSEVVVALQMRVGILMGDLDEASQQLDFVTATQTSRSARAGRGIWWSTPKCSDRSAINHRRRARPLARR